MMRLRLPLLCLALAGCGGGTPPVTSDQDAAVVPPDGGAPGPSTSCTLAQAPAIRPHEGFGAVVTAGAVFVGDERGLWRAPSVHERFVHVTALPERAAVRSLVATDDGAVFAAVGGDPCCGGTRVFGSHDDGETWVEHEVPGVDSDGVRLVTDGSRVVAVAHRFERGAWLSELDRDTSRFVRIADEAPEMSYSFFVDLIGFDRGALVAQDVRNIGVYRLAPGATRWEPIPGLEEWGYETFLGDDAVRLITSPSGIRAETEGTWSVVVPRESVGFVLVAGDDGYLAIHAAGALRSVDGRTWEATASPGPGVVPRLVSRAGDALAVLSLGYIDGSIFLSGDLGASWRAPALVSEWVGGVVIQGDVVFADWSALRDGAWSRVAWEHASAFAEDGVWDCDAEGCAFREDAGDPGPRHAYPDDWTWSPARAFATSHGLFVPAWSHGTSDCGVVRGPMLRLAEGTWADASAGMPSSTAAPGCASFYPDVERVIELGGVLLASARTRYPEARPMTLRSRDGGASWEELLRDDGVVAAVTLGDQVIALLERGGLVVADATASGFTPAASQPPGTVTDLVLLEGQLVASTDAWSGPSLWVSHDGARTWRPVEGERATEIGAINGLDARGSRLAIASATSGVWEATDCF